MQTTRRGLLAWGALSALGGLGARPRSALGAVSMGAGHKKADGQVLVTVFLRGGADGLSLVIPHADEGYYRGRPTLALASPSDRRASATNRALDLDGFFGLHPSLGALLPLYQAKQMAIVHACGSGDQTRSHFEAMATVERGAFRDTGPASGWLARHLQTAPWHNASPLRAVALGAMVPETLRGATSATALRTVGDLQLHVSWAGSEEALRASLGELYGGANALHEAGREALSVLKTLRSLSGSQSRPAPGVAYPKDDLGEGLHQVALLMKSGVGLEAACLDHGGYDTHVAQGSWQGSLASRLSSLGGGLAAFARDLGPARWARTTVVVLSEFGRRVEENSGAGTDHGRAGVMFVLGGRGIAGGRVHGAWPGLGEDQLEGPGDLRVTTDYRNVLSEIVGPRLGNPHAEAIFPGLTPRRVGVVHG